MWDAFTNRKSVFREKKPPKQGLEDELLKNLKKKIFLVKYRRSVQTFKNEIISKFKIKPAQVDLV